MKISFAIFLLFIVISPVKAQYFPIKKLHTKSWDGTDYTFPELTVKSEAAIKINTFLQGAELNVLFGKLKKTAFEKILPAKGSNTGVTILEGSVIKNTASVFSVHVNTEYTSASLNQYTTVYNFDALTGDLLRFSDLFSSSGFAAIKQLINADRKKRLSNYLKTLNTKDEEGALAYKVYKDCLTAMPDDDLNKDQLTFNQNGLQLEKQSCFPDHYGQSLSDHADIYISKLTAAQLVPYLSAYGKLIVAGKSTKGAVLAVKGIKKGVYKGQINDKYPVTFLITYQSGNDIRGCYFYDLAGQQIDFSGSIKNGNTIELKTSIQDNDPAEKFNLTAASDGSLSGTWSKGVKTYKIQLR